jgi:hypothetical protein
MGSCLTEKVRRRLRVGGHNGVQWETEFPSPQFPRTWALCRYFLKSNLQRSHCGFSLESLFSRLQCSYNAIVNYHLIAAFELEPLLSFQHVKHIHFLVRRSRNHCVPGLPEYSWNHHPLFNADRPGRRLNPHNVVI